MARFAERGLAVSRREDRHCGMGNVVTSEPCGIAQEFAYERSQKGLESAPVHMERGFAGRPRRLYQRAASGPAPGGGSVHRCCVRRSSQRSPQKGGGSSESIANVSVASAVAVCVTS